jgi:hypothetical protein
VAASRHHHSLWPATVEPRRASCNVRCTRLGRQLPFFADQCGRHHQPDSKLAGGVSVYTCVHTGEHQRPVQCCLWLAAGCHTVDRVPALDPALSWTTK